MTDLRERLLVGSGYSEIRVNGGLTIWPALTKPEIDEIMLNAATEIMRLRSELSKAQPEWQPIAAAPMDGTEILGFGSASWRGKKYAPAHHVAWFADGKWLGRDPDADVELHLTEWTPLLAAPKQVVRQEGEQR